MTLPPSSQPSALRTAMLRIHALADGPGLRSAVIETIFKIADAAISSPEAQPGENDLALELLTSNGAIEILQGELALHIDEHKKQAARMKELENALREARQIKFKPWKTALPLLERIDALLAGKP